MNRNRIVLGIVLAFIASTVFYPRSATCQVSDGRTKLFAHSEEFRKAVIEVTDGVHVAVGYALANSILIEGDGGVIIVDTTESGGAARAIKDEFDKITTQPVKAIIYTHSHVDHVSGARVFAADGNPEVYAHEKLVSARQPDRAGRGRSGGGNQFGLGLPPNQRPNAGIGPSLVFGGAGSGQGGYIPPTKTFSGERYAFVTAGVKVELVYAPGETDDQIYVWLPEKKVLMPGDNFYRAFPNLYAIRGVPLRRADHWVASLAKMIDEEPEFLVPSHTRPIIGAQNVKAALTAYHDGIKSVLDQTLDGMNRGLRPDELAETVKLPHELAENPYLQEYYGTVPWSVRAIYSFYLGWFDGNATNLFPLSNRERSARISRLAGGEEALISAAREALEAEDYQWTAELADYVLSVEKNQSEAKELKAKALRALAELQINANARNWYLTTARALER